MLTFFLLNITQCLQFLINTMPLRSLRKLLGQCFCSRGPEQLLGAVRAAGTGRSTAEPLITRKQQSFARTLCAGFLNWDQNTFLEKMG